MEVLKLANLVREAAKELREDSRVVRAGRECGLTEVDLVFQGPTGDYAGDFVFTGNGDQDSVDRERTLKRAADMFVRFLMLLRSWRSFARRHGLMEIFVSIKQFAGAERRSLYVKENPSRVIPDDPMILF